MECPVIHWQLVTTNPDRLAGFYNRLFGWRISVNNALNYRKVDTGSPRGIGGDIWPAPLRGAQLRPTVHRGGQRRIFGTEGHGAWRDGNRPSAETSGRLSIGDPA